MRYIPTPSTPPSLAARILPALSPAAIHGSSPPVSLSIAFDAPFALYRPLSRERFANSPLPKRGGEGESWRFPPPPCIGSRTTSLSGRNRRYPADGRPGHPEVARGTLDFRSFASSLNDPSRLGSFLFAPRFPQISTIRISFSCGRIDVADVRNHPAFSLGEF